MIKCCRCSKDNPDRRYFCIKCGAFLKADSIVNKSLVKLPEIKMMRILENMKYVPHTSIVWNSVVDKYVSDVEKYRALCEIDDISDIYTSALANEMEEFLSKCKNNEFQIAFVGTIKTGKSTLINALLGKNYASMSVTPETAALTKFRSSEKDYIKVVFYSKSEWKALWNSISSSADKFMAEYKELNADAQKDKWIGHEEVINYVVNDDIEEALKPWTSSQYPEHYFVKEVEVGISNLPKEIPSQVVFVDTPGLADPVAYRSQRTVDYINKADAVFVCIDAQKIQQAEIETINSVFSFSAGQKHKDEVESTGKKKVFVVATHWDILNDPEDDWMDQKEYLYKQLTGKACYETREMAAANITYAAAYIHNLCRDFHCFSNSDQKKAKKSLRNFLNHYEDDSEEPKMKVVEELDFMSYKANVWYICEIINERLIAQYKEILLENIKNQYKSIQYTLKRIVREASKRNKEMLEVAQADIEECRRKIANHQNECQNLRECQENLRAYIQDAEERTQEKLEEMLAAVDREPSRACKNASKNRRKI